ncbi:prepilin-type N-terminal cleavage/methylation domain-containing protein [Chloroflexota bacterium]
MIIKDQRGTTLVEVLIATALSGLIASLLGAVVYQITTVSERGNAAMISLHEVQNVAYWVNLDGQRASAASGGSQLIFTLPDESTVTYDLSGTELRRTAGGSQVTVARNITSVNFLVDERVVSMSITSCPQNRWEISEDRTYKVYLRPSA